MRILDRERLPVDLSLLGLEPESWKRLEQAIEKPYGMLLVTGPTVGPSHAEAPTPALSSQSYHV